MARQTFAAPSSDCSAGFKLCAIFSLPDLNPLSFQSLSLQSFFISKMFMLSFFSVLKIAGGFINTICKLKKSSKNMDII